MSKAERLASVSRNLAWFVVAVICALLLAATLGVLAQGGAVAYAASDLAGGALATEADGAGAAGANGALATEANGVGANVKAAGDSATDREDYGWIYRQGDYWYLKLSHPMHYQTKPVFCVVDGRTYYSYYSYEDPDMQFGSPWLCYYYDSGALSFQLGNYVDMDEVVAAGCKSEHNGSYNHLLLTAPNTSFAYSVRAMGEAVAQRAEVFWSDGLPSTCTPRKAAFDAEFAQFISEESLSDEDACKYYDDHGEGGMRFDRWSGLFKGCSELAEIEGIGALDVRVTAAASAFAGCEKLRELDLSGFDTRQATDLQGMFDGCASLARLTLGEHWTQAAVADDDLKAQFPIDMTCGEGADERFFSAGDIIPDGAAAYVAAGHVDVAKATVRPLDPLSVEGAEPVFKYTGGPVEPALAVEVDGRTLEQGTDYTVEFTDNVEEGRARFKLVGTGDCFGAYAGSFAIVDTDAYAFLYKDGTLVLKVGHALPDGKRFASADVRATMKWVDPDALASGEPGEPGAPAVSETARAAAAWEVVPWSNYADQVKHVVVDESFAAFAPTSAARWFAGCSSLKDVEGLGHIDGSDLTSVAGMFAGCAALGRPEVQGLDTSRVRTFDGMFEDCTSLSSGKFAGLSFASAESARGFFKGCSALASVDLSPLSGTRARDFAGFFEGCSALQVVNLGDFDASCTFGLAQLLDGAPEVKGLVAGAGWRNAGADAQPLAFGGEAYCAHDSFARLPQGAVLPDGAGEYRMRDIAMQFCTVSLPAATYECTGVLVQPKPQVTLGATHLREGEDFELSYANNLFPGRASVTVLGKGSFSGGLVVPFNIEARVTEVGDRLVYETPDVTYTLKVTAVAKKDGRVTGVSATIVAINVQSSRVRTLPLPSQCTVGGITADVTAVSSKLTGTFRNVKSVIIGPTVVVIGARAFANAPKVKSLIVQSARLAKAKNCLKGSKVKKVTTQVWLTKKQRKTYKKWFTKKSGKKGVRFIYG